MKNKFNFILLSVNIMLTASVSIFWFGEKCLYCKEGGLFGSFLGLLNINQETYLSTLFFLGIFFLIADLFLVKISFKQESYHFAVLNLILTIVNGILVPGTWILLVIAAVLSSS